jgi:phosphocarrier protein
MVIRTVTVTNEKGVHLRFASELVKTAEKFDSEITIEKDSEEINAKSILGVAGLGLEFGMELVIKADGKDERDAIEKLVRMFDEDAPESKI